MKIIADVLTIPIAARTNGTNDTNDTNDNTNSGENL